MKIEYVSLTKDIARNRQELAVGAGIKCVYSGGFNLEKFPSENVHEIRLSALEIPFPFHLGSMEVFESGAVNLFIRKEVDGPAVGFLRFR